MMLTFPWMPSSFVGCANIATLAHCDAVRRGHPLHQPDAVAIGHFEEELSQSKLHLLPTVRPALWRTYVLTFAIGAR